MRVPRQWSGADLKKALAALGYEETRQTGSHVRLTTQMRGVTSSPGAKARILWEFSGTDEALPFPKTLPQCCKRSAILR